MTDFDWRDFERGKGLRDSLPDGWGSMTLTELEAEITRLVNMTPPGFQPGQQVADSGGDMFVVVGPDPRQRRKTIVVLSKTGTVVSRHTSDLWIPDGVEVIQAPPRFDDKEMEALAIAVDCVADRINQNRIQLESTHPWVEAAATLNEMYTTGDRTSDQSGNA